MTISVLDLDQDEILVTAPQDSSLTVGLQTPDFSFAADEPVDIGGDNKGPDPFKYLLFSIGACTAMTLKVYARHKGITLPAFQIKVGKTSETDKTARTTKTVIRRTLLVPEGTDAALRDKMVEIAHKCPVHRTLEGEIAFETTVV